MSEQKPNLPELYHRVIGTAIDEKGVFPHQCIWLDEDGKVNMGALALNRPDEVMAAVVKILVKEKPTELMYGLDRFSKPGQGTELKDLIAGAYWNGEAWRVFTIEYQNDPRIVKPIDWDNDWWKHAVRHEITQVMDSMLGAG